MSFLKRIHKITDKATPNIHFKQNCGNIIHKKRPHKRMVFFCEHGNTNQITPSLQLSSRPFSLVSLQQQAPLPAQQQEPPS